MLRKRVPRRALRVPVKFWRSGEEDESRTGYTLNFSAGGMFVATWRPMPPNAVVEFSIEHPDRTVRTTARVVHAARYPPEFQRLFKSGMGVLFHTPEDPAITHLAELGQLLPDRGGRRQLPRY